MMIWQNFFPGRKETPPTNLASTRLGWNKAHLGPQIRMALVDTRQPMEAQPSPDKVARTTRSRTSNPRSAPPDPLPLRRRTSSSPVTMIPQSQSSSLQRLHYVEKVSSRPAPLSSPQFRWWLVRFLITSLAGCSLFPCSGLCGCWSLRGRWWRSWETLRARAPMQSARTAASSCSPWR